MGNITRRHALKLSGQAFLALSAAMPFMSCTSAASSAETQTLNWQEFIDRIQVLAETQFKSNWDQQAYTEDISKIIRTLDVNDNKILEFTARYKNKNVNFPEISTMHKEQSFMVSFLEFEPGEKIALHDHPDMTGVIHCIQGRINIQNYTLQKERSESGKLLLKQEASVTMTPGSTGALSSTFGNIHSLQADKLTRMVDVFTPPYNRDRSRRSKWFKKSSAYYQGTQGLFEAEVRG